MIPLSILVRVRIWFIRQARGSWSAHGIPWVLLSRLWLTYCAHFLVCLMQLLGYMLWMKKCLMNYSVESEQGFYM